MGFFFPRILVLFKKLKQKTKSTPGQNNHVRVNVKKAESEFPSPSPPSLPFHSWERGEEE